ncbi:MAG: MarR family transcriptional regulator [Bdellovibrionota bacterium]
MDDTIEKLHREVTEFAKKYQLRRTSDLACPSLNVSQAYALGELIKGSKSMSELASYLRVSLGSATKIVDSLELLGFVKRKIDQNDRRSFVVSPTSKGAKTFSDLQKKFQSHLSNELANIPKNELTQICDGLAIINEAIDSWRDQLEETQ